MFKYFFLIGYLATKIECLKETNYIDCTFNYSNKNNINEKAHNNSV